MDSIFHRVSIRKFTDQKIEPEKVELLMRAAMAAPSAGNQQPWEFYVVTNREKLAQLAAASPYAGCAGNAPVAVVICRRFGGRFPDYAVQDLSACTENLLLEADALGLGAVWLGIAPLKERMDAVALALGLPDGLEAFAVVACGYPAETKAQQDRYDGSRVHLVE